MVFICYSSMTLPHQQYLSCVKVMGSYVQIFLMPLKLFYRLTYIVCQVFKRVYLPTSMKRHIDVSELLRFIKGHLDIFSCIIPVFKLSFNKLLQSKNYRKGVFLIDEWIDLSLSFFFSKRGLFCILKRKDITAIDPISKNMLYKYFFQAVLCIFKRSNLIAFNICIHI